MADAHDEDRTASGGRWQPGQSGNPNGRPLGARGRATIAAATRARAEWDAIVDAMVVAAKAGDVAAARMLAQQLDAADDTDALADLMLMGDTLADLPTIARGVADLIHTGRLGANYGARVLAALERAQGMIDPKPKGGPPAKGKRAPKAAPSAEATPS